MNDSTPVPELHLWQPRYPGSAIQTPKRFRGTLPDPTETIRVRFDTIGAHPDPLNAATLHRALRCADNPPLLLDPETPPEHANLALRNFRAVLFLEDTAHTINTYPRSRADTNGDSRHPLPERPSSIRLELDLTCEHGPPLSIPIDTDLCFVPLCNYPLQRPKDYQVLVTRDSAITVDQLEEYLFNIFFDPHSHSLGSDSPDTTEQNLRLQARHHAELTLLPEKLAYRNHLSRLFDAFILPELPDAASGSVKFDAAILRHTPDNNPVVVRTRSVHTDLRLETA